MNRAGKTAFLVALLVGLSGLRKLSPKAVLILHALRFKHSSIAIRILITSAEPKFY